MQELRVPPLSPNMSEAVLVAWRKHAGDSVKKGEVLYEIETDKVVSEVEADRDGILREIKVEEGERVAPDACVAVMESVEQ